MFEVKFGNDGREYAVFVDEYDFDLYCEENSVDAQRYSFSGYYNAILLDHVVTE